MIGFSLLLVVLTSGLFADGANILMIPWLNASHYLEMDGVGRQLVARGHKLYVLFDEDTALPKGAPYQKISYRKQHEVSFHFKESEQTKMVENSKSGMDMRAFFNKFKIECMNMMSDPALFPTLQSLQLDLVLIDLVPSPCYYMVPYKLGVPFGITSTQLPAWQTRVPILPSVVRPVIGLELFGLSFCKEVDGQLSIVRRFCRMLSLYGLEFIGGLLTEEEYMHEYAEFDSMDKVRESAAIMLVNANHLLSDPLPKLPNVEYVGGLTTKPAKPLEASLETWMSLKPNVVVVSFGSMLGVLPPPIALKLVDAFGRLPSYRFLWRFKNQAGLALPSTIPPNVRLMDWLPQNDLLGHNSTRLFITHSGNNGQQEALYHGVPMLCFFVQSDQISNAKRVAVRGFGSMLSLHDFDTDQLVQTVAELIENATYSQRIKTASRIFHADRHPAERAADAVEHVLKFGSAHLRPTEAYELSFWEYYMLDVLAVLYTVALMVAVAVYKVLGCVVRCVVRRCAGERRKTKAE